MAPRIDGSAADYSVTVSLISRIGTRTRGAICSQWLTRRSGGRRTSRDQSIQWRPGCRRRRFAAMVQYLLLLRFIAARRDQAMNGLAETEGFEPSIGLYNPITV